MSKEINLRLELTLEKLEVMCQALDFYYSDTKTQLDNTAKELLTNLIVHTKKHMVNTYDFLISNYEDDNLKILDRLKTEKKKVWETLARFYQAHSNKYSHTFKV